MLYTKDFCICPWCDARTTSSVDHLYDEIGREFGPWYCSECRKPFRGTINGVHDVTLSKVTESRGRFTPSVSLLRFDGKEGPTFFVMKSDRYEEGQDDTPAEAQEHQRYFYEEHSCPTNWLRDCIAVINDGDTDPHGFLTFVRSVDVGEDFDEDDDGQWPTLFPEAFGGPVIDGSAQPDQLKIAAHGKE